jgi:pimeloyl-ACP methyl ester carboxylesterase
MKRVLLIVVLLAPGCAQQRPVVETGIAELGQAKLYYEMAGEGEPTVVMLHGGMLDCTMWAGQFELLVRNHTVLRYDASAHGRSALPPEAYLDHLDLLALLDHLEIDRAVLVGLSLGGRIAIDFALEYPERVAAVVAVGPGLSGYRFDGPQVQAATRTMISAWKSGDFDALVEAFQRSWTDGPHRQPKDVDPEVRERVRQMARSGAEKTMEGRMLRPPAIDRLDELDLPMLVVVGELDMPGIHEIADMLVAANPNAERVTVPGVGHYVNLEAPERFNELLVGYLEGF